MKCKTLLCAQYLLVDNFSKRLTAVNILEDSFIPSFPSVVPMMVFASFEKEATDQAINDVYIKIELNDRTLHNALIKIDFTPQPIAKTISNLSGLLISEAGTLTISAIWNEIPLQENSWKIMEQSSANVFS